MDSTRTTKVVLFDLDNTLFDHYHSLRSAISAVQEKYASLGGNTLQDLIGKYNAALQRAYDKYLGKEITYEETEAMKVQLFFTDLGLPGPSAEEAREFRATYQPEYRENRRATPGSIETLVRLREHGYRLAIISNGQIEDQADKAEAINIRHLVDRIFTSEEAGCCKPDYRIFQFAIEALGASPTMTYMVGDSVDSDIKGALNAGLSAILYSPMGQESKRLLFGEEVPVIRHIGQLNENLGITNPVFKPTFVSRPGQLVIEGIGIDLVTEPRHCLHISKETIHFLAENMGGVLGSVSEKRYGSAMCRLEEMIRAIAKAAPTIDETAIQISYPGQGQGALSVAQSECHFTDRDHSIYAVYVGLALAADSENEAALRDVAVLLQNHCNSLMRDYPRTAIRDLRFAMLILAEIAGVKDDTIIRGERIDE
jgi:HAD superfamily hydrolase (TIGR01549 family)